MNLTPNAKRASYLKSLVEFFAGQPESNKDGTPIRLSYVEIEQATGVPMGPKPVGGISGRDLMRKAIRRVDRRHTTLKGTGIELSAPANAAGIATAGTIQVAQALRRSAATNEVLRTRHLENMSASQRDEFTRSTATTDTMFALANMGKRTPKLVT